MDKITPTERSRPMARIGSKNTKLEMTVRSMVHRLGYHYRLHVKGLPGRPDMVFPGRRKVIFVHGCFWHWHNDLECRLARPPKSRRRYWIPKLKATRLRDEQYERDLRDAGWGVLVIWECRMKDTERLETDVRTFLEN